MYIHTINPILLSIGPLEIRWYGLVYALGFIGTILFLQYLRTKNQLLLSKDEIYDLTLYAMLGVLIGSRLFMIFWEPSYYLSNPLRLFKIWEGGMSFHGGFTGIIITVYLFARKKKLSFLELADIFTFPTMLALALGRIANFINGELWGTPTTVEQTPWCVNFKNTGGSDICRHPEQLYAAAYRFLFSFYFLYLTLKEKFKPGFIFLNFMLLEGFGRFIVDFWREDPRFLYLSLGQYFSLTMITISLIILLKSYRNEFKRISQKSLAPK